MSKARLSTILSGVAGEYFVAAELSPGSHRLTLVLGRTPNERAGWIASVASAALLAATLGLARRATRR